MKIFKYKIIPSDYFHLEMPQGSKILTIQTQNENPCIWALVNPEMQKEVRKFRLAGTGHEIKENPKELRYIGTFQMRDGALIFHVFEILTK